MDTEFKVGQQLLTPGAKSIGRGGRSGEQIVADGHGRYQEAVLGGNVFYAHNVAAQAVSVALATAYTGLCLSNPMGSGKNLVLLAAQFAITVAEAAIASQHLIGGYSTTAVTHTTPLAAPGIQSALLNGQSNSIAKVDSSATIPTPGYIWPLRAGFTAAALGGPSLGAFDYGGLFVIPPGGFIAIGALTAVTGFGAFAWEEVPQ